MKRKVAIVVVVAVVGIVTEIALRVGFGLGNPVIFSVDPAFGYLPSPNQQMRRFGSHVKINHAGMRSAEFLEHKPPQMHRILFVGDSVTFGPTFVDQANLFSTLIPIDLEKSGRGHWESLNASAPGWATGNEVGFIKSRGTFSADIVVLVINTGDLVQPFATCSGSNCPTRRPPFAIWETLFRYVLPRIGVTPGPAPDPGSTGDATGAVAVNRVIENIAQFARIVVRSGARFILVSEDLRGKQWEAPHWKVDQATLNKYVRDNHIEMLDLSAALSTQPAGDVYFDGVHLRAAGHAIVAHRLEQIIGTGPF